MKPRKKKRIVINPQCISHIWSHPDSSELTVYLSCSDEATGSCLVESEGKVEILELTEISFLGVDAKTFISLMGIH
ncbi:hypothetical protein H6F96_08675 [Microcoleus sp. FACHB-53]|nr:hypothetical protein [Microcoleus sp. FACHB-53]